MSDQPIYIMPSDTKRTQGREAQRNNIAVAKLVAETVRTTLGPKGMDKMIVDDAGDVTVTNDGVTILQEMNIEHPTGKMIVEIAKTQEHEVGDGTTTAVVLAGELLKRAEALLDEEIHPTVIARGYVKAAERAHELLQRIVLTVKRDDTAMLRKVAMTATTGKGAEVAKERLAELVVEAVTAVSGERVDRHAIKVESKEGATIDETELIHGLVLDKERVHPNMPTRIVEAKILLLDTSLEVKGTETDAKISISDPARFQEFLDMEERMLKRMCDTIIATGATVLLCQKGIDDVAQHFLAKAGIFALRRLKKSDLEHLAKATGARIVSSLDDATKEDLGRAGTVEEIRLGTEALTYVRDCPAAKAVTILARGGTPHVAAEIERAVEDAIGVVATVMRDGAIVAGAGSPELEVSRGLREYAATLSGREQLAVQAFAEAMEIVPRTLAENAGIDPIDAMTMLKAAHEAGEVTAGIDVFTGKKVDAEAAGIVEPLRIKSQAISSATEVAVMILRIDDVINGAKRARDEPSVE